jgi:8-oxo-dGTP diphosphatase
MMKKKTVEGLEERRRILEKYLKNGMMDGIQVRAKELNCMPDDIMDAVCLAVSAALKAHGMYETIPEEPETDARGLVMQMVVPAVQ